eukprot:3052177-Pyramimonas_sp.AAC.1
MPGMEYMPFASLLFDSSALAWAWLYGGNSIGLPPIAESNALRVTYVASEGYQVQDVIGVQCIAD